MLQNQKLELEMDALKNKTDYIIRFLFTRHFLNNYETN